MLLILICRQAIDARTRLIAGLFTQIVLVNVAGLAIVVGLMAAHTTTYWLESIGLAIAPVALFLSLITACLPMGRVALGQLRTGSAGTTFKHEGFFWRASWVMLTLGVLCLSLPIWMGLLLYFELGKAMVMLGICFMAVGAFFANQLEQMRGSGREA